MDRRTALRQFSIVIGGTLLGADSLLAKNINWEDMEQAIPPKGIGLFTKAQVKFMNEVADTILPDTKTPGAKAAKTGQFMAVIVSDCYEPDAQARFMAGLDQLDATCKKMYGKSFMKCKALERHDLLVELDHEQKAFQKDKKSEVPNHYFRVIKDLVLWGYFTSEIGATQALRFVEIPGRYETIEYKKGDRAWG